MYRIAIVDDAQQDAERLEGFLQRYQEERSVRMEAHWFLSAEAFLEQYSSQFEIVFMDIHMGGMDGMKAARALRDKDQTVILIFLTSLAQYAVQGYEVDALDYIVKPLTYPALELKLHRALSRCQLSVAEILIGSGPDTVRVREPDLIYVEIFDHHLQYKTSQGVIRGYGTLKDVERALPATGFFRVNNQAIINLRHVQRISGNETTVDGRSFDISRMRKKDFLSALHRYGISPARG